MKKSLLTTLCIFLLAATQLYAQNHTVTGKVTAREDGLPVPGVSVSIKGTTTGTQTDANGRFSLSVPNNALLSFSFLGYITQTLPADGPTVNVVLVASSQQLGEVVVTGALGLNRTRNQQAYAAQKVTGDEVSKQRSGNFVSGLSGKVAGLEIRQNNALGGSTNVVLRGTKSILGNNQALFVVDGVPYNNGGSGGGNQGNSNSSSVAAGTGGYDYGSPASDINPDDIESVTVLKGAAATALYGSIGANGVILITTKKVNKGLGITFNTSYGYGAVDKSTLPTYQKQYGGGYGTYYEDPSGYFLYRDINGDGVKDLVDPLTEDASYGHAFDPNLKVYQWDAFSKYSPNFGKATPWVAAANDPNTFFTHPISNNQSLFITNGGDNGTFKLGYTRNNQTGFMPNSNELKNNLDFGGTYNINSKLTAAANISYTRTDGKGRYGSGYQSDNILNSFRQWYQVNNDIKELKDQYFASGGQNITWNWASPTNLVPIYWDNPYFIRYQNFETDTRNRYFGNVSLNYKATNWLNLLGRVTVDNWSQIQEERRQVGSVGLSSYTRRNLSFNETNFDFLATTDNNITQDLNFKGLLGVNVRKNLYQSIAATTNGGLIVPSIYSLSNSKNTPNAPTETYVPFETDGIFAGATFTWKKMVVLDGTLRRDASSALPSYSNKYYYPSVNLGFTFSELLKQYSWLSYGKVRINYAEVGNSGTPQSTSNYYSLTTAFGSSPQAFIGTTQNNAKLKPERTKASEGGLEMAFFNNRLGFDFTYYNNKTVDQLIPVTLSTATGYNAAYINSGTIQNKGIEVALNGTPVQTKDFTWKVNVNFTRNRNKVLKLYTDGSGQQATNLQLGSFQGGVSLNASLDRPYGDIRGNGYVDKDGNALATKNGQQVVGDDGYYVLSSSNNVVLGNVNPNWTGGINSSFRYKSFTLSFLVDVKKGGSVFSLDTYYGMDTGLYPETVGNNDLGKPSRNALSDGGGVILPGVTSTGAQNTVRADNTGSGLYGYEHNPAAGFVYDAGYVKLREAAIAYSLPQSVLSRLGSVKGIDVGLSGRNLWIIHKNTPYTDPEEGLSSGNLQGYQSGAFPTARMFNLNLKVRF
ncbi:SusC/RagA family TonB-linked outer membrane protein [Mucilaginibacter sp. AW1-7]|jgi:TonB-linked SusC/RagA family outer membrane protein|uniref:SusC/RagA family TonB-linked outer membrane protein n=1 Tax=unclassified Mucilaginibacter TaxID=2617802 RepID=UPI0008CC4633|nr:MULTISPECIES: SusC/RagA family TonB-linked outer membrane protein [unclassified Mucilaginibacter]WDF77471.1 SusC/RagA family TonB-linked outer membrane protein [Mucilaginibacter sp. KACC 22773]SEO17119.1 TonB-linked outer membrane protein, SusC/RagA family [Mucilaginibacter sp. OK283]